MNRLAAENAKLRKALAGLIPWAGESPEGPAWATSKAKQRNTAMFNKAIKDACDCFPEDYNGVREIAESN
jgi:hypothetical protein